MVGRKTSTQERNQLFVSQFLVKRNTVKWELGDGKFGTLSYEKMRQTVNRSHPRVFKDGETKKLSIWVDTGRLAKTSTKRIYGLDELGIGVSIYFKLLKSIIFFFCVCFIINIPLLFIYASGEASDQVTSQLQQMVSKSFLGNIGEQFSDICAKMDIKRSSTLDLRCPPGQKIESLTILGLPS